MNEQLASLALTVIAAAIIGVLLFGLALLLRLPRSLRSNVAARKRAALCFAGLAFLIGFVGIGYGETFGFVVFCEYTVTARGHIWEEGRIVGDYYPDQELRRDLEQNRFANINEAWIRQIMPAPLRRDCYTSQVIVCDLVDRFDTECSHLGRAPVWRYLASGLLAALVSGTLVWRIGRPKSLPEQNQS